MQHDGGMMVTLPAEPLQAPLYLRLCNIATDCASAIAINAPDVGFAQGPVGFGPLAAPGVPEGGDPDAPVTAVCGQRFAISGRALAFTESRGARGPTAANAAGGASTSDHCVHAAYPVTALTGLTLALPGVAAPLLPAAATCYDVEFILPQEGAGCTASSAGPATYTTPWGATTLPRPVVTLATAPAAPAVFDVDKSYGGNVAAALAAAGKAIHEQKTRLAEVRLGATSYELNTNLFVPDMVTLAGQHANVSKLIFRLPGASSVPPENYGAIFANGSVALTQFTVEVLESPAQMPAVLLTGDGVSVIGLNITLRQQNVSNALQLRGSTGFEIAANFFDQGGLCLWPYHSDTSNFQASTTLYLHNTSDGNIHNNSALWHCSFMDLDTSSRIFFANNRANLTDAGLIPHGNSISVYDWRSQPASRHWLFARNTFSRPPHNNASNYFQRETVTTDGKRDTICRTCSAVSRCALSSSSIHPFYFASQAQEAGLRGGWSRQKTVP
jgi:hypothetical protein